MKDENKVVESLECACGAPQGSTCTSTMSIYKDSSCTVLLTDVPLDQTGPACVDIMPPGAAIGSKKASPAVFTPGVCEASGGVLTGEAHVTDPVTFCCLP